ncbi:hypothetical protein [Microbacterium sp. bgisy203]|uniref:hypothetical protein n=1 Tax=Microbacterium sp. bgisy203 TaxID=3413799 RepID=UPI003D7614B6
MPEPQRGLSPQLAVAFTTIGFFALVVAAFGMLSLLTDADVLAVPGLGQVPGAVAVGAATLTFAVVTWVVVRRPQPTYGGAAIVLVATFLAYLGGLLLGGMGAGVDPARAAAAVGGFATSWFAVVLASAAFISAWIAVALVRTRATRPRWPWERDDDEI